MRKLMLVGLAGLLAGGMASAASAQSKKQQAPSVDTSAQATYGDHTLNAGFNPDPYRVDLTSGGAVNASDLGGSCTGMVAVAPDVQLNYGSGSLPLTFSVRSDADTTLVINGPDGRWSCDDDSGDGSNPQVTYQRPLSGIYDVYVGAYGGNSGAAQLLISELGRTSDSGGVSSGLVDASAPANFGEISLSAGFTGDPRRVQIYSGGAVDAAQVASGCVGMVSRSPDYQVTYDAGSLPLTFGVTASGDTTIMINGPDGRWYCDDDSGGQGDPEYTFRNPQSGIYDVWVGAYGGRSVSGELFITELGR
ncbi:hypothetical protein MMB232_01670 [Brevundimonas subvibrioides]|uniref:peptidase n=1 Tax=Brevundimonas subvibrioides TaxID=74313 RepID=UPI0032D58AD1